MNTYKVCYYDQTNKNKEPKYNNDGYYEVVNTVEVQADDFIVGSSGGARFCNYNKDEKINIKDISIAYFEDVVSITQIK